MPLSPEWANLPRRKCDDCGKTYKPVKPSRPGERGFCSANCRKSYHKHGGAYRKLKGEMQKMVARQMAELENTIQVIVWRELTRAVVDVSEISQCGGEVVFFQGAIRPPEEVASKPAADRAKR